MKIFIRALIMSVSFLLMTSCGNEPDHVYFTTDDVADEKLAFQKETSAKARSALFFRKQR